MAEREIQDVDAQTGLVRYRELDSLDDGARITDSATVQHAQTDQSCLLRNAAIAHNGLVLFVFDHPGDMRAVSKRVDWLRRITAVHEIVERRDRNLAVRDDAAVEHGDPNASPRVAVGRESERRQQHARTQSANLVQEAHHFGVEQSV